MPDAEYQPGNVLQRDGTVCIVSGVLPGRCMLRTYPSGTRREDLVPATALGRDTIRLSRVGEGTRTTAVRETLDSLGRGTPAEDVLESLWDRAVLAALADLETGLMT
jgi:hypothetical protein